MTAPLGTAEPDAASDLQTRLKASILHEWVLSTAALLLLTFAASYFSDALGLKHSDNTLYDPLVAHLVQRPASDEIMIVAIDDTSIQELGYWPWRRAHHAELLERLAKARVVALDLVFNEHNPAYPDDDAILAQAIRDHGRVVLPLVVSRDEKTVHPPIPILADAAAYLGYINIYPDADGIIRSFPAQKHQADGRILEHLSLKMLDAGQNHDAMHRLRSRSPSLLRVAYAPFLHDLAIVPYGRVLDGSIPASAFDGKYVLVGSWGSGLGDTFTTPHSNTGQAMPGVEVLANLLNGGLTDQWIQTPSRLLTALLCMVPVLISCIAFRYLSPQWAFLFALAVIVLIFTIVALLLYYALWWLPPSAALIGTILAYPVWSWRSQHAALSHIDGELALLDKERLIPHPVTAASIRSPSRSFLSHDRTLLARIRKLHYAIDGMRIAQRQRNETLRFLSHDMRAPLNSILALTDLQRHSTQPKETNAHILSQFDYYAHKTLALVDGFVELSRAEAIELVFQPVNLSELITQSCEGAWVHARQKQIRINADVLPESAWVNADGGLLERVWSNLLDNALKYSPEGTTITCAVQRDGADWIARIQDQGRGMDTASLESAFSPFVRIDEHSPENPMGVGLGLAFVRTVVTRHGGHIDVQSKPDAGTCFTIRLPALEPQDDEPDDTI